AALGRRRVMAVVLALGLASAFVDLYLAYVGDSVEVLRHTVGPQARLSLLMVVSVGVGADTVLAVIGGRRRTVTSTGDVSDENRPGAAT
ncbi:MAG TPA: hypothetical protein PLV68_11810, partial [Ilumatobacteraceae bacterium]|nr:hypothetical protein [Ilumatobacteraceae bacterium]